MQTITIAVIVIAIVVGGVALVALYNAYQEQKSKIPLGHVRDEPFWGGGAGGTCGL